MPMIPEAVVTMLAIVRLGAVLLLSSPDSRPKLSRVRILDSAAQFVFTADGRSTRRTEPLKPAVERLWSPSNVKPYWSFVAPGRSEVE